MLKKIILNSGIQILGRGVSLVFSILLTSILTRQLGISGYGNYILITTLINLLITTSNWGSQIIGVRELSRTENQEKMLGNLGVLRLALSLITIIFGIFIIFFLPVYREIRLISLIVLPVVLITNFGENFYIVFQTKVRMDLKTLFQVIDQIIVFLFTLFLLSQNWKLAAPLAGILIAKTIIAISSYPIAKNFIQPKLDLNPKIIKKLFLAALPLGIQLSLFSVYDQTIDSFIIKNYLGTNQVGIYGLAYKIYSNLVLPAYYLNATVLPMLSTKNTKSKKSFKLALGLTTIGAVVIFLLTFGLSDLIINLISGSNFSASGQILKILAVSLVFAYFNHLNGFFLIAKNKQVESFKISLFALIWNMGFNLALIPQFGILAAAWVTVSTEALVSIISTWRVIRCYNIR